MLCVAECATCVRNLQIRFTKALIFLGFGFIHGLVPLLTRRLDFYPLASDGDLNLAAFATLVGLGSFSVGWRMFERVWRRPMGISPGLFAWITSTKGQATLRRLFWVSAIGGYVLWYFSAVMSAGSISAALAAGRFEYRSEVGMLKLLLNHSSMVVFLPGFLGFFLSRRYCWGGICFALSFGVLVFLVSRGARSVTLGILGGPILGFILTRRVRPVALARVAIGVVFLFLVGSGLYEVRKVMSNATLGEMVDILLTAETYENMLVRDPFNYHQMMVAAVHHFPDNQAYVNGATYRRILFFYLPRGISSGLKPADVNVVFGQVVGKLQAVENGTTIPPSVPGDAWINFWGLPGVVGLMFLNGLACGWILTKADQHVVWFVAVYALFFRQVMMGLRGQPYDNMVLFIFLMLASWVALWLSGWRPRFDQRRIASLNIVYRKKMLKKL